MCSEKSTLFWTTRILGHTHTPSSPLKSYPKITRYTKNDLRTLQTVWDRLKLSICKWYHALIVEPMRRVHNLVECNDENDCCSDAFSGCYKVNEGEIPKPQLVSHTIQAGESTMYWTLLKNVMSYWKYFNSKCNFITVDCNCVYVQ